jgi:hypothetical protein
VWGAGTSYRTDPKSLLGWERRQVLGMDQKGEVASFQNRQETKTTPLHNNFHGEVYSIQHYVITVRCTRYIM